MREHYERLLAPIYGWMLGDRAAALARSRQELLGLGVAPAEEGACALDLGAGLGLQSIPLADLGYRVTAVDVSGELLHELASARPDVRIVRGDVTALGDEIAGTYAVIACMGDTLTHLPNEAAIDAVFALARQRLRPSGRFLLTLRDYSGRVPDPPERFILVRGDDDRILTCHLDYQPGRVLVTDVVHERRDGRWSLRASTYAKLRVAPGWLRERLETLGFRLDVFETGAGRIVIAATLPGA